MSRPEIAFPTARVIPELERGGAALSDSSQSSRIHPAALPAAGLAYEILIEGASISTNAMTNPVCVDRNRRSLAELSALRPFAVFPHRFGTAAAVTSRSKGAIE
jgi:hypothetical protein